MKIRALALAAALAAFATPALAFHCPADGRIIEAAIALNPALTAEQLVFVRALWDGGMALHAAGPTLVRWRCCTRPWTCLAWSTPRRGFGWEESGASRW